MATAGSVSLDYLKGIRKIDPDRKRGASVLPSGHRKKEEKE